MTKSLLMVLLFGILLALPARAQPADDRYPGWANRLTGYQQNRWGEQAERRSLWRGLTREIGRAGTILGGRPAGCPHRFCGCALSIRIFGRIIPRLNLAANWRAFPTTSPKPGMVAVRSGHVFELLAHQSGITWRVWDANSGRGKIRIHNRSIAGYSIVNPRERS